MLHAPAKDDCPCEDDIAAFLRGRLTAEHTPALEAHVVHCAACRRLLSMLAQAAAGSRSSADSVSPTLPLEPSTRDAELQPGTRFGRYLVLDLLGAGGMGAVYAAYDPDLNRKVALKVLHDDGGGPADQFPTPDTLLREAQAMAQLAHPNVVTVFEAGTIDGCVFIAMELVEGMTLATWLAAARRARSDIITAFVAAGHGLAAAHAAGLIHRDFKPENVLIGHDGRVRVTDFGLAPRPRRIAPPARHGPVSPGRWRTWRPSSTGGRRSMPVQTSSASPSPCTRRSVASGRSIRSSSPAGARSQTVADRRPRAMACRWRSTTCCSVR
jgi:serine/threonine protein kinase